MSSDPRSVDESRSKRQQRQQQQRVDDDYDDVVNGIGRHIHNPTERSKWRVVTVVTEATNATAQHAGRAEGGDSAERLR